MIPRVLATVLGLAALSCGPPPPPQTVPVLAAQADLTILVGDWWGEYSSVDTGRSGRIRFSLEANANLATGDVQMFPQFSGAGAGGGGQSDDARPHGHVLTLPIEFIRVRPEDETVSGTIERYEDPSCQCLVSTTFVGQVSSDRIEGTFETKGGPEYRTTTGRWRVDRKEP